MELNEFPTKFFYVLRYKKENLLTHGSFFEMNSDGFCLISKVVVAAFAFKLNEYPSTLLCLCFM